jgi:hypothetical protein
MTSKSDLGTYDYYNWGSCTEYRPHAVRDINNGAHGFCYDANDNNTWRFDETKLWWQSRNPDNKLSQVDEFNPSTWTLIATLAQFFYDGALRPLWS